MKMLISLFCIFFVFSLQAQPCFGTGLATILSTQGQIDSFPLRYPLCKEFGSDLVIQEADVGAITNLDSLRQLERTTRDLRIVDNAKLSSLHGLHQLVQIGGSLHITGNALLPDLSGLDSLKNIGSGLSIVVNPSLTSLMGLDKLSLVKGNVWISNNQRLLSLSGLDNLEEVGAISIRGHELIRNLKGLGNLKHINGYLIIGETSLTDIFDLSGVRSIGGALRIEHNNILRSLSGLDSIDYTTISDVSIENNDNLSLCAVASICAYLEAGKPARFAWNGASECDDTMHVNHACTTMPITPNSNCFSNSVTFSTQDQIDSFPMIFPECRRLLWNVTIEENEPGDITNLNSLAQVQYIGGTLTIQNNKALINLTGLDAVPNVGKNLVIQHNDALLDFTGLGQLRSIGGHLSIIGNEALATCKGLDSLTSIDGSLLLKNNTSLESLSGLGQIGYRTIDNIAIDGSPLLSDCAEQSICDFLNSRRGGQISRNAEGCNSGEEVKALCTTTTSNVRKDEIRPSFNIYPNPASSVVEFDLQLQRAAHLTISIYDYLGRQVAEVYNGQSLPGNKIYRWHVSTPNSGLYFCRLQVGSYYKENRLVILR